MFYRVSLVHTESTSESVNLKVATLSYVHVLVVNLYLIFFIQKKKIKRFFSANHAFYCEMHLLS